MQKLVSWLSRKVEVSASEARAFIMLSGLLALLYVAYFVYRQWPAAAQPILVRNTQLEEQIAAWLQADSVAPAREFPQLFAFNPNTISADSLQQLGLPAYLANRIVKYRTKVRPFAAKPDLLKVYGLSPEQYTRLEPYLLLPAVASVPESSKKHKEYLPEENAYAKPAERTAEPPSFNLNQADTSQLSLVYGIGPTLSARIVKFREKLGGFVRPEQVREVYGLPPEVADRLLSQSYLPEQPTVQKVAVNSATVEELAQHPYIGWKLAKRLVAYRKQHQRFSSSQELYSLHGLTAAEIDKLLPYLTFEP